MSHLTTTNKGEVDHTNMPFDPYAPFGREWEFTRTSVVFPSKHKIRFNPDYDWISIQGDRFILARSRPDHALAEILIGPIADPQESNCKVYSLGTNNVPAKKWFRAWLLKDYFLFSPDPADLNSAMFMAAVLLDTESLHKFMPFKSLIGVHVGKVHVSPNGLYFLMFDPWDYITVVFNQHLDQLKKISCGSCPYDIDDNGEAFMRGIFKGKKWKLEL